MNRRRVDADSAGTTRPVAFALTAPSDTTTGDAALQLAGPYWLVVPPGASRSDPARITDALRAADAFDWRGPTVGSSDRSPLHWVVERHPALNVARLDALAARLGAAPSAESARVRERRVERFLQRAGLDRPAIDEALRALRPSSGEPPTG